MHGSGKSHYTREYSKGWRVQHKNGEIYIFSALKDDPTLDEIKVNRIKIDDVR